MTNLLAFNLNSYVLVKLLPKGFELWRDHYSYMPTDWQKPIEHYQSQVDSEGYCKLQMWEFMQIFGPHITLSTIGLFETNVLLSANDLSPHKATPAPARLP